MRITVDENIPRELVSWLRNHGFDVLSIRETAKGSRDSDILRWAMETERVVITLDKDFGELVFRRLIRSAGVILVRYKASSANEFVAKWEQRWEEVIPIAKGNFILIEEESIRVRAIPPANGPRL